MSGAEAALEAAVFDLLRADERVRAELGDPLRGFSAAEGLPAYPYLEISGHEARPAGSAAVVAQEHRLDLAVVARLDTPGGVRPALGAVREALDGARPLVAGWRCVLFLPVFADVLAARRGREVRGLLRMRAVLERP